MEARRYHYLLAVTSALCGLAVGYNIVVVIGAEPSLPRAWSHIASLMVKTLLGGSLGAMGSAILSYHWGRRTQSLTATIISLISITSSLFLFSQSSVELTRFALGFGLGMLSYQMPFYLVEATSLTHSRKLNNALVALTFFASIAAIILVYTLSLWLTPKASGQHLIALGGLPIMALTGLWYYLPESPCWLINNYGETEARNILGQFTPSKELDHILSQTENYKQPAYAYWQNKAQLQLIMLAVLQQGFGLVTVLYLAPILLPHAGIHWAQNGMRIMLLLGVIYLAVSLVTFYIAHKTDAKGLMLAGTMIAAGCTIVFGSSLHHSVFAIFAPWLTIATAICLVAGCSLSYGALLVLLTAGQYCHDDASHARTLGVTVTGQWLMQTAVLAGFLYLLPKLGPAMSFWPLSLICILGYAYAYHLDAAPSQDIALSNTEDTHEPDEADTEKDKAHDIPV